MTIEQKAKRYDEAIKIAKDSFNYPDYPGFIRADVVFPELIESEDERIRKSLITFFQRFPYTNLYDAGLNAKDTLAWLEKQAQKQNYQTPIDVDINSMVESYKQRLWKQCKTTGDYAFVNACAAAFKEGVENTLDELDLKSFINKSKEND